MPKCIICGVEEHERWMKRLFVGRGAVYMCWECYEQSKNKLDERSYEKRKKFKEANRK